MERRWCVAGYPLPLQPRVLDLVIVNEGKAEVLRPDAEFLLLDLKVSQYCSWLDKALAKPVRWWWMHGFHQRLIQEIIQAIPGVHHLSRNGKLQKVPGMSANTVVKIVVRDTEVLVLSNRKAVTLAFGATTFDGQDLQWIIEALKEDLTNLPEEDLEGTGGPRTTRQGLEGTSEAGGNDCNNQTGPQGPSLCQVCVVP